MIFSSSATDHSAMHHQATAWRWRYHDPRTGELVLHSEPLTADEMLAINPRAELIPGSRVAVSARWFATR